MALPGDGPAGRTSLSGFGVALTVTLGGTMDNGIVLAGMLHAQAGDSASIAGPLAGTARVQTQIDQFAFLIDWYPDPRKGWHAGAAAGIGSVGAAAGNGGDTLAGTDATGSILGGYDGWIGPQWSLGVTLIATGGTRAALRDSDGVDSGYRFGAASLALEAALLCN